MEIPRALGWLPDIPKPVEDQGQIGPCTANAAVGLLEYFEKHGTGAFADASRLFVYKTERDLLGWTGDTGAWGDGGYAWLSYRYVTQGLALDWWTMISANWVDTGQFA